ncbi:MAG: response regulator [Anaerolineae bacterium]
MMQPVQSFDWQQTFTNDRFRILFVDDNLFALKSIRSILERAGYVVYTATNREEALDMLACQHIHLGIFDLNLARESDSLDEIEPENFDGLELASNPHFPLLRMVYTGKDDRQIIVDTMNHPQAVNYIVKGEDSEEELVNKVDQALSERLPINQELEITWEDSTLQYVVQAIYPTLTLQQQFEHLIELDDLWRMQFLGVGQDTITQVRINRINAGWSERVWLRVSAYSKRGRRYDQLVLCASREGILHQAGQFDAHSPLSNQMRLTPTQTVHYGLQVYELFDGALHAIDTLAYVVQIGQTAQVLTWLNAVYDQRFVRRASPAPRNTIGTLYQLALGNEDALVWETSERLFKVVNRLIAEWQQTIPQVQLSVDQNQLVYGTPDALQNYPHPILHVETLGNVKVSRPVAQIHGDLRLDTILIDTLHQALYLMDYSATHSASSLRDYVTLERSVHLILLTESTHIDYAELAQALNDVTTDISTLPFSQQSAVTLIRQIRQMAQNACGTDHLAYLQDLYIDFVMHLLTYPPHEYAGYQAVREYGHCLMMASQLCMNLQDLMQVNFDHMPHSDGLVLDRNHNRLRKLDQYIDLTDQQFDIFEVLYHNFDQECTFAEIITKGLHEDFNEANLHMEKPRIQTAISRLRNEVKQLGLKIVPWRNGYRLRHSDPNDAD